MAEYLETVAGKYGRILVEVGTHAKGAGFAKLTAEEASKTADSAFALAMETVRVTAGSVLDTLNELPERPDDVQVEFGIRFDAAAGAMLAHGPDAQLKISLTWKSDASKTEPSD
jgi:hypothetical protein